jgi:hypothetical protein
MEKKLNDLFENIKKKIALMKTQIDECKNPADRLYAQKKCAEEINQICTKILDAIANRSGAYLKPLEGIKKDTDKVPASDDVTSVLSQIKEEPFDMGKLEK